MREMRDLQGDNAAATYFVPSFSVRRHITRESAQHVAKMQSEIGRILGRQFRVIPAEQLSIKSFEQGKMIERMRQLGKHPAAATMDTVAKDIQKNLTELLSNAPPTLALPLGELGLFGYDNRALGVNVMGWKGNRAQYAIYDDDYRLTPLGTIAEQNEICLDRFAAEFEDDELVVDDLASMPHVTLARHDDRIYEETFRKAKSKIQDVVPDVIEFGDPVIYRRLEPSTQLRPLFVRDARLSLAAR
jgi:hypothetical protein